MTFIIGRITSMFHVFLAGVVLVRGESSVDRVFLCL